MGTPGSSAGPLFLPSASAPPRKRAAGEAGVARSKQRVLDEEEYIEVLAQCERWRLSGPSPDSRSSPSPFSGPGTLSRLWNNCLWVWKVLRPKETVQERVSSFQRKVGVVC